MSERDLRDLLARTGPPGDSREAVRVGDDAGRWEAAWHRYWLAWDAIFFAGLVAGLALVLTLAR